MYKRKQRSGYDAAHMTIPWHDYAVSGDEVPAASATLSEKASVIGKVTDKEGVNIVLL